ncbi:MAG: hypothetical protein IPL42_13950 [Saprospiraceae bacterium]|nr:hypothetical protein [Saprospiraceae bacterium]
MHFKLKIYNLTIIGLVTLFNLITLFSQSPSNSWIVGYGQNSTTVPKFGKTELKFNTGSLEMTYNSEQENAKTDLINTSIGDEGVIYYYLLKV